HRGKYPLHETGNTPHNRCTFKMNLRECFACLPTGRTKMNGNTSTSRKARLTKGDRRNAPSRLRQRRSTSSDPAKGARKAAATKAARASARGATHERAREEEALAAA